MLNNIDDDYITSIAIGLFIGLFEDNCINKKFRNMENEGGILNGEFIKNHLKRETELEDKIFELENKIKILQDITNNTGNISDKGHRLLIKIAMRMQIELPQYGYESTDIGIGIRHMNYGVGQLRVDGVDIDEQELQYLKTLIEPNLNNISDSVKISPKVSSDNCIVSPVIVDPDKIYKLDANYDKICADSSIYAKTW